MTRNTTTDQTLWTSAEAKRRNEPSAATQRDLVYGFISDRGAHGATDDEVQVGLNLPGNTQCPRRLELAEAGRIMPNGETRPTRKGRRAAVWVAAPAASPLAAAMLGPCPGGVQ
jgi:hypothetical protein